MSIDEKSRRIVQPHLLPGETLAWAGPAAVPPRPVRVALLVGAATFLGIVLLFTALDAWFFWFSVATGLCFGAFIGVWAFNLPVLLDRLHNKPTHYAITDRRILFFSTPEMETLPVAAYGPQDIQFVRRQDRPDGTSDILIRQHDGPGRATQGPDGIAVPFQAPTPEVALRGVAEGGAVAALIEALRSGALAAPAAAAVVAPAAAAVVAPAAAAVARVSMPAQPTGEQEIILKKSAVHWPVGTFLALFGLFFLAFGIAISLGQIAAPPGEAASATQGSPLSGLLIFGGIGLACILLGLRMTLRRDVFTANPVTRTYRLLCGYVPFAKPVVGTFADFAGIRFTREDGKDPEGDHMIYWHVRLHWKKAGREPYDVLAMRFVPHGAGEAARMAAALGLPLDDRSAEVTPTERKAQAGRTEPRTPAREVQAVQAEPQTPERKERRRRLRIAGGIALGLLLVNSFVKGVVWEDQWTAPDGSAIMRRTTGFWWQTVAISPQGERSSQTCDQYFSYTSSTEEGTLPDGSGPRINYRRGLRLGSQSAADDAPGGRMAASNAPGSKSATHRFQYDNKFDRPKGPRYWTQISPLEWQEKYANGMTTKFRVERRAQVGGDADITAYRQDGTSLWVFIPDWGSRKMRLRFRFAFDRKPGWTDSGEMTHIH